MKKLFFILPLLFLYGCGGGSSSGESSSEESSLRAPSEVEMETGTAYTLYKGDQILKTSDQASVRITHIDGSTRSTATLLEGSAMIKHN
jgi:uncharacterized lipoprotein YehR (DUF1307 family)